MEYEVGKYYKIKCAVVRYSDTTAEFYIPVIGGIHKDPQLGVNWFHIHVDGRFKVGHPISVDDKGRTNQILEFSEEKLHRYYFKELVLKRRKCIRDTTGLKPPEKAEKYNAWYKSMLGKSCKGKRCPHLGTEMLERNGVLVCPIHNLHGCPKKEIIIEP